MRGLDILLSKKGVTRKAICDLLDISESALSRRISGRQKFVNVEELQRVALFLDCSIGELLTVPQGAQQNPTQPRRRKRQPGTRKAAA